MIFELGAENCGWCHSKDRKGPCHCLCHTQDIFNGFHEVAYGIDTGQATKQAMDLKYIKRYGKLD